MATYWENSCSFGLRYVSWYKYLIVSLVFSHLGFWSGNLFLIAPFPDLCLLVLFFFLAMKKTCYALRKSSPFDCTIPQYADKRCIVERRILIASSASTATKQSWQMS